MYAMMFVLANSAKLCVLVSDWSLGLRQQAESEQLNIAEERSPENSWNNQLSQLTTFVLRCLKHVVCTTQQSYVVVDCTAGDLFLSFFVYGLLGDWFLEGNSALVTQDSFIAFQTFAILISIDITIKIHQFVCIKQAQIEFRYDLTFEFSFYPLKPDNCAF